jgi:hypothetical protein
VVHFPADQANHLTGDPVVVACKPTWQNMRVYQAIMNNTCLNINAELLLVSRLQYTIRIFFCPLVVVVKFMTSLPHLKGALTKERKPQHIVEQTTDTKFLVLEGCQAPDAVFSVTGTVRYGTGTGTVHAVLSRRFSQHAPLLPLSQFTAQGLNMPVPLSRRSMAANILWCGNVSL